MPPAGVTPQCTADSGAGCTADIGPYRPRPGTDLEIGACFVLREAVLAEDCQIEAVIML